MNEWSEYMGLNGAPNITHCITIKESRNIAKTINIVKTKVKHKIRK